MNYLALKIRFIDNIKIYNSQSANSGGGQRPAVPSAHSPQLPRPRRHRHPNSPVKRRRARADDYGDVG